jgi:hypothetical protein
LGGEEKGFEEGMSAGSFQAPSLGIMLAMILMLLVDLW